jgi:small subunit ribosomal protein S8
MVDRIADMINTIKTNERIGRPECILLSTKMSRALLDVMKRTSYINGYEEFNEGRIRMARVALSNRINNIGVVKPRVAVKAGEIQRYEMRYIPSRDFGILVLSTSKGLLTNKEAKEQKTGGRLIAYVY